MSNFCVAHFICYIWLVNAGLISGYVNPVLTPGSVQDAIGNKANEDDVITWNTTFPEGQTYLAKMEISQDKVTTILHGMINGFTRLVQPEDPPYDLLSKLMGSGFDISGQTMTLLKFGIGIAICFSLGMIFVIFVPCVGCCFCCCRISGHCGGKLSRPRDSRATRWCRVYTVTLLVISAFMIAGCCLLVLSSKDMTKGVVTMASATQDNFKDISTFADNLAKEFEFLALDGYKFISTVIKRDLDNIDYLVGIKIKHDLDSGTNINSHLSTLMALVTAVPSILRKVSVVNASTYILSQYGDDLQADLDTTRSNFVAASSAVGCLATCQSIINARSVDIDMNVDYATQVPDLATNIVMLQTIQDADLGNEIAKDMIDFDEIPLRVKDQTKDQVLDIKTSLDGFLGDIDKSLTSVTGLKSQVESALGGITSTINKISSNIKSYTEYITYGSFGMVAILGIIILLQVFGAFGAMCCYDADRMPQDRSKSSHRTGNLLMASAGLSFMFSWILMLLVLFPSLVGIILDRDVCDQLSGPEYPMFKSFLEKPGGILSGGYDIGGMSLTISETLSACSQNQTAYKALKMMNIVDIHEVTDYQSLGLEDDIAKMDVNFMGIYLLSTWTSYLLDAYKTSLDIDYPVFNIVLSADTVKTDFAALATGIRRVASDGTTVDPAKSQLLGVAQDLDNLQANKIQTVEFHQTKLLQEVNTLETLTAGKAAQIDQVKVDMSDAEAYIQMNTDASFNQAMDDFQKRLISVLDKFVKRVANGVEEEAGGCLPLYHLWTSLVDDALCTQFVQPFNAVWFTLGWCVFCQLPSIILNIKLAKYIRRATYKKNKVEPEQNEPELPRAKPNASWTMVRPDSRQARM